MGRRTIGWLSCIVWFCCQAQAMSADEKPGEEEDYGGDLVLQWFPPAYEPNKTVELALNQRRISDGEKGMREFLDRARTLPQGGAILCGPRPEYFAAGPVGVPLAPNAFPELWTELQRIVAERGLNISWSGYSNDHRVRSPHASYLDVRARQMPVLPVLDLQWRNYPVKGAPRDQVVYVVNGRYVGLGDRGFDEVLKRVQALPLQAELLYNRYEMQAKPAIGVSDRERLAWQELLPFNARKADLDRLCTEKQLKVRRLFQLYWPKPDNDDRFDEVQPLAYYATMLRIATIIRGGQTPTPPKIKLSWKWDRANQPDSRGIVKAAMTGEATYYVNDAEVGKGTTGFLAAIEKIKTCKAGDVIQINPACIRTKGPFSWALVSPGHRLFETTGTEPFQGLVDILADVVERQRLRVELIPDEGKPDRTRTHEK